MLVAVTGCLALLALEVTEVDRESTGGFVQAARTFTTEDTKTTENTTNHRDTETRSTAARVCIPKSANSGHLLFSVPTCLCGFAVRQSICCSPSTPCSLWFVKPHQSSHDRATLAPPPCSLPTAPWPPEPDSYLHAGTSAAIQLMGYGGLRALDVGRRDAYIMSAAVTVAAGIGKELYDRRRGGDASTRDLLWDAVGLGLGLAMVAAVDR